MDSSKEIKVYGTLVNWTNNPDISDNTHNDAIAYSRQLYDDTFDAQQPADKFQDVINKRISAVSYNNGTTRIAGNFEIAGILLASGNISSPNTDAVIAAVDILNGDETVNGSVKKQIKTAIDSIPIATTSDVTNALDALT